MKQLSDILAFFIFRALSFLFKVIPLSWRFTLAEFLLRATIVFIPRFKRVAMINLRNAFPEKTAKECEELFQKSLRSMSRFLVDSLRVTELDAEWIDAHVEIPRFERLREIYESDKGVLVATGHLGSFELLAQSMAVKGYPLHFVVRDFDLPRVNEYWKSQREQFGNTVISRKGAYRDVISALINLGGGGGEEGEGGG